MLKLKPKYKFSLDQSDLLTSLFFIWSSAQVWCNLMPHCSVLAPLTSNPLVTVVNK